MARALLAACPSSAMQPAALQVKKKHTKDAQASKQIKSQIKTAWKSTLVASLLRDTCELHEKVHEHVASQNVIKVGRRALRCTSMMRPEKHRSLLVPSNEIKRLGLRASTARERHPWQQP